MIVHLPDGCVIFENMTFTQEAYDAICKVSKSEEEIEQMLLDSLKENKDDANRSSNN